ncbi:MAG: ABC transporter permease [Phycisphaerae bacterium]|nr:ABC transporter permease [Phycisphaerae bacterium]
MGTYIIRRLFQAIFTIFGVMIVTFLLFRVVAGDIAAAHLGDKATEQQKQEWRHRYGYDKPYFFDFKARPWQMKFWDAQFWNYIGTTATFGTRSIITNEKLYSIIAERAPYSLALTVPILALQWAIAMTIATIVAYYRASLIDSVGVFLSVLGMCIPYLAFILGVQYVMFQIRPSMAYGLANPLNIFVPVGIGVLAGLGSQVRFYRTVVLDETRRDYVRTAAAKGVPLPAIMFKHILKNCMLPILTNLILAIPFLIMGSLLLESFFGINGLGDLLLSSINSRDEPIVSGLTFLTALLYIVANLATDISYVFFDPRVKLS